MRKRLLLAVNILVAFIAVVFAVVALYWVFWPVRTLEIHQPDKILNPGKQVHAGNVLIYEIDYCKYTTKQALVTRVIQGSVNYSLPASTNNVATGCKTAISRNTIVPEGILPGQYTLGLTATYVINPLRTISVRHNSEVFTVLAKDISAGDSSVVTSQTTSQTSSQTTSQTTADGTQTASTTQSVTSIVPPPDNRPAPSPAPGLISRVLNSINGLFFK